MILFLKAQGHVTVNKPVISMIYIVAHTWPLCSAQILVGWGESTIKLLLKKSINISAVLLRMGVWFISLENSRVHLHNNTYILRKVVENLCDVDNQKS